MWQQFDADGSGAINVKEFLGALETVLGFKPSQGAVESILSEIDFDGSGAIEFGEFCHFFDKINDLDEFRRKRELKMRASVCLMAILVLTSLLAFITTVMMDVTTPASKRDTQRFSGMKTLIQFISGIILAVTVCQGILVPLFLWKCKLLLPYLWRFLRFLDMRRRRKKKTVNVEVSAEVARKIAQNRRLKTIERRLAIAQVKKQRVQPAERDTYRPESTLTDATQPQPLCITNPGLGLPEAQISQLRPAALLGSPAGAPPSTPPLLEARAGSKEVVEHSRSPSKPAASRIPSKPKPPLVLHYPIQPLTTSEVQIYGPERYAWMQDVQQNYVQDPQGFHGIKKYKGKDLPAKGQPPEGRVDSSRFDNNDQFSRAHRSIHGHRDSEFSH